MPRQWVSRSSASSPRSTRDRNPALNPARPATTSKLRPRFSRILRSCAPTVIVSRRSMASWSTVISDPLLRYSSGGTICRVDHGIRAEASGGSGGVRLCKPLARCTATTTLGAPHCTLPRGRKGGCSSSPRRWIRPPSRPTSTGGPTPRHTGPRDAPRCPSAGPAMRTRITGTRCPVLPLRFPRDPQLLPYEGPPPAHSHDPRRSTHRSVRRLPRRGHHRSRTRRPTPGHPGRSAPALGQRGGHLPALVPPRPAPPRPLRSGRQPHDPVRLVRHRRRLVPVAPPAYLTQNGVTAC